MNCNGFDVRLAGALDVLLELELALGLGFDCVDVALVDVTEGCATEVLVEFNVLAVLVVTVVLVAVVLAVEVADEVVATDFCKTDA